MPQQLIIFPFGGNGREALVSAIEANKISHQWDILGFVDDNQDTWGKDMAGYKVLGDRSVLEKYPEAKVLAVPGNAQTYLKRQSIIEGLNLKKERFATIISPNAVVSPDAVIGCNTFVMPYVFVACGVSLGNHCIILSHTLIHHDSVVDDYNCIGSSVTISGDVKVEKNCYIGSGTNIKEKIIVGERSLLGLGSNVVSNITPQVTVVGNPARVLKS